MWKIFRGAYQVALLATTVAAFTTVEANATDTTISQNTSGFTLPGVQLPQGHDEVRAADGTTCRSAVGGSGAYIDMGFIGNPSQETGVSAYGRMVIPLARKAPRLDCSKLYNLEVARLEMELKLMQMGLTRGIAPVSEGVESDEMDAPMEDLRADAKTDKDIDTMKVASLASPKKLKKDDESWADDGWSNEGLKK